MKKEIIFKSEAGRAAILTAYDEVLNLWPVPYESKMIATRHGETHIIACGNQTSPPLVLLHGSASNATMWIGDVTVLAAHYRVYAVDMPGEPGKSEPLRRGLEGSVYAEWMEDIFSGLGFERASILGISLGGWMALRFATIHPDQVEKLVLLCPAGVVPVKISFMFRILPYMLLGSYGQDKIIKIVAGNIDLPKETTAYIKLINANFNPRTTIPVFPDEELQRLTMPVLLVAGGKDAFFPSVKTMARLRRLVPDVTSALLPEAGHLLLNLTDRIVAFLDS